MNNDAKDTLEDAFDRLDLRITRKEEYDDNIEYDKVIRTEPRSGEDI